MLGLIPFFIFKVVQARPVLKTTVAEARHLLDHAKAKAAALNEAVEVQLTNMSTTPVLSSIIQSTSAALLSQSLTDEVTLSTTPTFDAIVFRPTQAVQLKYNGGVVSHSSTTTIQFQDKYGNTKSLNIYYESGAIVESQ